MSIHKRSSTDFLAGLLFGGLAGAATALLLAPRSGEQTREMFRESGIQLRDRATHAVKDSRERAELIADQTKAKLEDLQEQGRRIVVGGKERIEKTVKAVKSAAQTTWAESGA